MDPETQRLIAEIQSEIRELTQVMRNLGSVMSAVGDEEIKKFSTGVADATNAVQQETKVLKENTKVKQEMTREEFVYRRQQRSAFRDLVQEMSTTRGAFSRLEESALGMVKGNVAAESSIMVFSAGVKGATAAVISLGRALYQGQQGATVAAKALNEFANTVGTALQGLGLALTFIPGVGLAARVAGIAIGALGTSAKLAGEANILVAEQSDRLYRLYQDMAVNGIAASDGMIGLARSAQELGFGLDDAGVQAFAGVMRTAATDLALMSGSVQEGRKRFMEFNRIVRDDVGEALQNLGMTPETINQAVAAFVQNQTRLGRAAMLTNRELTQGSIEYIRQLDLLTKLTGQDAKSVQDRMDADLREERFRAGLMQIERTEGKAAAETLRLNVAALGARFPEVAAGLKDLTGGFAGTEASARLLRMGISGVPEEMKQSLGGGFQQLGRVAGQITDTYGESLGVVGAFNNVFGSLTELVELAQLSLHDYNSMLQEARNTQMSQAAGAEGVVGAQTKMRRSQMDIRDSLQDLVKSGVAPATGAMEALSRVTNQVVQGLQGRAGVAAPPGARMGMGGADLFAFGGGVTGNRQNYDSLDPEFRQRLTAMAQEYQTMTGKKLPFGSGQRSQAENLAVGGAQGSLHMQGRAADLTTGSANELARLGLLEKYGFKQNPRAAAHISDTGYATGGIASGPRSGYEATLHGTEAVVPLPDGKTIPVELKLPFLSPSREQIRSVYGEAAGGGFSSPIPGLRVLNERGWAMESPSTARTLDLALQEELAVNKNLSRQAQEASDARGGMMDIYDYLRFLIQTPEGKVWAAENYFGAWNEDSPEVQMLRAQYNDIRGRVNRQQSAAIGAGKFVGPALEDPMSGMEVLAEDYLERQGLRSALGVGNGGTPLAVINEQVIQQLTKIESALSALNQAPRMAQGGITQGVSIAGEAGPEAVIPLANGRSIPVEMAGIQELLRSVQEMVTQQRNTNSAVEKLIQVTVN